MSVLTCIYLLVIIYLLFVRTSRGTGGTYADYIRTSVNLTPFSTVSTYIERLSAGSINKTTVIYNIIGNIFILLPLGFAAAYFISAARKFYIWLPLMLGVNVTIEAIQLLSMRGSFDIDDIILNMTGAIAGYFIWVLLKRFLLKPADAQNRP